MKAVEVKEEMRLVDGQESVVYVDKTGKIIDNPDLTGKYYKVVDDFTPEPKPDEAVDERGVPLKNVVSELKRKLADAIEEKAKLQKEKTPVQRTDRVKAYREKLVAKNIYSPEEIEEKVEVLQLAIEQANEDMSEQIKGISQPLQTVQEATNNNQRKELLQDFQDNPEKYEYDADYGKLVGKHKNAILKELENIPLVNGVSPFLMEAVIGKVFAKKKVYASKPRVAEGLGDDEVIVEPRTPPMVKIPSDVNAKEFASFVADKGIDISTAEKKNSALSAFRKKKEFDKMSEPK